jgi:hypothetical protein
MFLQRLAAGVGFPLGFIGRGEAGGYQPGQSLSRQYQPFAKRASRLQRAFLTELVRLCQIDLAFKGLDPYIDANAFSLNMASVSPIVEIERAEVIQLRMDRMERAIRFGADAQLKMEVWTPFVLEKYGGLPRDLVAALYEGGGGEQQESNGKRGKAAVDRKTLNEAFGAVMPEVDDRGSRVHSYDVAIDGVGLAADRKIYRPVNSVSPATVLSEGKAPASALHEKLVAGDKDPFEKSLSPRAEQKRVTARKERRNTRVELISSLAGLPPAEA